ncbi:response regulator [Haloferula sargassicola]|uniref:Response regulator protein VraR n=1 Tax=Haloferula sargassicola TaxID=490096 RepID=A0ABP9UQD8_9BACT
MTPPQPSLRVLFVEDHPLFRMALGMLLASTGNVEIAAEADRGADALARVEEQEFDLILLDIRLPDMSGIDVARELRERGCDTPILVLSMRDESEVRRLLPAGVSFFSKAAPPEEIAAAVQRAAQPAG